MCLKAPPLRLFISFQLEPTMCLSESLRRYEKEAASEVSAELKDERVHASAANAARKAAKAAAESAATDLDRELKEGLDADEEEFRDVGFTDSGMGELGEDAENELSNRLSDDLDLGAII